MNAVRSMVVAVALVGGSVAGAADGLGPDGLVSMLPAAPVQGGGPSVDLYLVALNPDGSPMTGLVLKSSRTVGLEPRWTEVGGGIYRISFAPPDVDEPSVVSVVAKGKSPTTKRKISESVLVQVDPFEEMTVGNGKVTLTLGRDSEIVLPTAGVSSAGVLGRASAGTLTVLPDSARYVVPKLNYPHVAVLGFADARDPLVRYRPLSLRLNGSVEYPLKAEPGASVSLLVGERTFGPVLAGADGKARVPVEVPPGIGTATQITTRAGQESREEIDLKIPETRRLALLPLPSVLPADAARPVPVRVIVRTPTGAEDEAATPVFSPSGGSVGPARHVGEGVYEAEWRLPEEAVEATLSVSLDSEPQKDSLTVALVPRTPATMVLSSSVTGVGPDTETIDVKAVLTDASGAPLVGADLAIDAVGTDHVGDVVDLGTGEYWFTVEPGDAGPITLRVRTRTAPSTNSARALVVAPEAGQVPNDGATKLPLVVAAVDAQGLPVVGTKITLDLVQGDGTIASSQLVTGPDGLARTSYVAGAVPALIGIRATSDDLFGYGALLQVPIGFAPIALPMSGTARDVARVRAFLAASATLVLPRGEETTPNSPWTTPVAASVSSRIEMSADHTTATPGQTLTVTARFVPPPTAVSPAPETAGPTESTGEKNRDTAGAELVLSPTPITPTLMVTGATMGTPAVAPDGTVTVAITVPDDAKGTIEITADAAGLLETITLPVAVVAASGLVPSEPVAEVPRPDRPPAERRWFRGALDGLASTYLYTQSPSDEPGPLLPSRLAVGGADGGNPARPLGAEVDLRAWGDPLDLPWLGVHGQVRVSSYGIRASTFDDVVRDSLLNVEVDALARAPFSVGKNQLWAGAKIGYLYNDFLVFTGCLEADCSVGFAPIGVSGFGVGPEVGAEIGDLHVVAGYAAGFASLTPPYAHNVDLNVGYEFVDRVYVDLGFGVTSRSILLKGKDSGVSRGRIDDFQTMGKLGIGFAL